MKGVIKVEDEMDIMREKIPSSKVQPINGNEESKVTMLTDSNSHPVEIPKEEEKKTLKSPVSLSKMKNNKYGR